MDQIFISALCREQKIAMKLKIKTSKHNRTNLLALTHLFLFCVISKKKATEQPNHPIRSHRYHTMSILLSDKNVILTLISFSEAFLKQSIGSFA